MISLSHSGGGEESADLIQDIFKILSCDILEEENDAAILGDLAFSTDSFTISPLFINGTNIGQLAVCGTINDLLMVGSLPLYLSCSLIIEEGFSKEKLKLILKSMQEEASKNNVKIVCGDTKVVPKGSCDELFINTSGIGKIIKPLQTKNIKAGQKILISQDIGKHGAVVFAAREQLVASIKSDCKSLKDEMQDLLDLNIYAARDATRGGLAAVLHEWSKKANVGITLYEDEVKVLDEVLGICELMGFEPYELANEGTFIVAVDAKDSEKALELLRKHNQNAAIIADITDTKQVIIKNSYGVSRFLEYPKGELLPRIC